MRFYILLTLLALLAGVFAEGDAAICRKANSDIVQAINNMCGWTWDLTVPSYKASNGANSNNNKIKVLINGSTCKPAQWVPRQYCLSQFFRTCAANVKAGREGSGEMRFGRDGCQRFQITRYG